MPQSPRCLGAISECLARESKPCPWPGPHLHTSLCSCICRVRGACSPAVFQVVVNIHSGPHGVLETFRIVPLLSNGKTILSEPSEESGYTAGMDDAVVFCHVEKMPELCRKLCADERLRRIQEEKAYNFAKTHHYQLPQQLISAIQL